MSLKTFLAQAAGTSGGFEDTPSSRLRKAGAGLGFADLSPSEVIGKIINGFLGLLGVVFLVLMVYAGFLWMTAGGKEEKVETAKSIIKNSIIGLVLVLAAYGITKLVLALVIKAT